MTRPTSETPSKLEEGGPALREGNGATPAAAAETEDGPSSSSGKKERVLHTRVPAVLERELKRFAENLRMPVSNLVRTILEDAVNAADAAGESVEGRLKRAAQQLGREREKLKKRVLPDQFAGVYAFQPVTLAQPAACAALRPLPGPRRARPPRHERAPARLADRAHLRLRHLPPARVESRGSVSPVIQNVGDALTRDTSRHMYHAVTR